MTRDALYCFENEPVNAVAQKMADWWVRRLPVVNRDKRLVGMVSLADVTARTRRRSAARPTPRASRTAA